MEPDSLLEGFFDRIKSDLSEKRRRRIMDLAIARNLLTPSQSEALKEADAAGTSVPDRTLVDRGWLTQEQLAELRRAVDSEAFAPSSSPLLARYELHEKLGEGAMSQVFRGIDRQLQRPVAVKILKENLLFQDTARKRFGREAQSLARMDHPNVVRVYDSGETGSQMYLVMEFVEGEALGSLLGRKAKDQRGLIRLLEQAARGIHHAHQKGIIHRDIKPQNILVTRSGEPKVADFGLAHLLDSDPELTGSGAVLGTPLYMAPEQVGGGGNQITHRTDVYALGAILYEILTGGPPHRGSSISEVYEKILYENPVPPHRAANGIAPELEVIALKAIEKYPSHRYASAEDFAEDLRRYLAGEPILARPVSTLTRGLRWARKRQGVLWPVLITGFLLLSGASLWQKSIRHEGANRLLEQARPSLDKASQAQYSASTSIEDFSKWAAEAQGFIGQAVERAPDLAIAHHRRGEVESLRGHYEEAERAWRKAVELDPKLGSAHFRLGQVLLWRAYQAHLDLWTKSDRARKARSKKLGAEGAEEFRIAQEEGSGFDSELQREISGAMQAYLREDPKSVLEICGKNIDRFGMKEGVEEFYWLQGLVSKNPPEQIKAFDKAIQIKPKFPFALYTRAHARTSESKPESILRAREDFSLAIRIHPDFSEAYIFRGSIYLQEPKDIQAALADFNRSIELGGDQVAAAYNGRASVRLYHLKDIDGAIADCDQAIRLQPDDYAMPYHSRAIAQYKKGHYDAALEDAARELKLEWLPGFSAMRQIRAKCFDAKGAVEAARAEVRHLLGPKASPQEVERQLKNLHDERLKDEKNSP